MLAIGWPIEGDSNIPYPLIFMTMFYKIFAFIGVALLLEKVVFGIRELYYRVRYSEPEDDFSEYYFVSFAHGRGFGSTYIESPHKQPFSVASARHTIAEFFKIEEEQIAILFYTEVSEEDYRFNKQ